MKSVPSEEQAKQLWQEMIEVMAAGGFNLTKFKSNSPDVLSSRPDDKHDRSTNHLENDREQVERTLGVSWEATDDCFTLNKSIKQYTLTKRRILRTFNSIFDPLGFLAPLTLKAKLLIKSMWCKKLE